MKDVYTQNVEDFLRDPSNLKIAKELLVNARDFVKKPGGLGNYGTDGSFDRKKPTIGQHIPNPTPGHRWIRWSLFVTAAYSQGLSYFFDKLEEGGHVTNLTGTPLIFDESNINRSLILANQHFKSEIAGMKTPYPMTLTGITTVSTTSTAKNRRRIRDDVAPVFVDHGLWSMEYVDGERAKFRAGLLLVLFSEIVLGGIDPFEGEPA